MVFSFCTVQVNIKPFLVFLQADGSELCYELGLLVRKAYPK
jgi:hypothetical protein